MEQKKVAILMGSDSDWPVVKAAAAELKRLGIPCEAHILSAHRTPAPAAEFAKNARAAGFGAIICAAGMAAHLAGAIAANTTLPVIGIPKNAAILAAQMLAITDEALAAKLDADRAAMAQQIAAKEEKLQAELAAL